MFAPTLGRYAGHRTFDDLQQGLLHTFAGDVAGDGGVVGFAGNLVDFVDEDDAALRPLHIVVRRLQESEDDILDVFAHISGLGEGGGVGNGEGYVQDASQGLGQEGFSRTGGADHENVALGQFDIVVGFNIAVDAFVMVVDRNREHLFGILLADDVLIQHLFYLMGGWDAGGSLFGIAFAALLLFDYIAAQIHALIADEDRRAGDELTHLVLGLGAKRAVENATGV